MGRCGSIWATPIQVEAEHIGHRIEKPITAGLSEVFLFDLLRRRVLNRKTSLAFPGVWHSSYKRKDGISVVISFGINLTVSPKV